MSRLEGAWRLDDALITFADGREPVRPFGDDHDGLIVYAPSGHMSAVLSRGDRAPLGVGLERAHRATDEAKAEAFSGYLSYAGRWRIEGDEVVHAVELALVPDLVGAEQRRRFRFVDGRLELSYGFEGRTYTLTWRRA